MYTGAYSRNYSENITFDHCSKYLVQGGHGTGKTGSLVLTFSRQGKHREFCCDTGKIFETQGKYFILAQGEI